MSTFNNVLLFPEYEFHIYFVTFIPKWVFFNAIVDRTVYLIFELFTASIKK